MKKFLPKIELGEMEPGVIFSLIIWPFITQVMIGEEGRGKEQRLSHQLGLALLGPRVVLGAP